jgi:hypothetical protein
MLRNANIIQYYIQNQADRKEFYIETKTYTILTFKVDREDLHTSLNQLLDLYKTVVIFLLRLV